MEFRTGISKNTENDTIIRGEKLSVLAQERSFTDVVFLLFNKRLPTDTESKIFGAMMTSSIDHGMGTASSMASRFVASTGADLSAATAAGVLAISKYHGGAIEATMNVLQEVQEPQEFVKKRLAEKKIIPGFGHKIYKSEDPRVVRLTRLCTDLGYASNYLKIAQQIENEIEHQKGKKLCLNIDGFIAAILLGMEFKPAAGNGVFIAARTPGLIAQVLEEQEREKPVRRVTEENIMYDGN